MGRYPSAINMHMSVDKGVCKGDRMRVHKGMHVEARESVRRCARGHTKGRVEGAAQGGMHACSDIVLTEYIG